MVAIGEKVTRFSVGDRVGVGQGHRVGVIGMGGLGHMGAKLARAMGAEVTLFTRSPGKAAEGKRQGAHHVIVSTDDAQMAAAAGQFDFLLDTVPVAHDLNPYIATLKNGSTHPDQQTRQEGYEMHSGIVATVGP